MEIEEEALRYASSILLIPTRCYRKTDLRGETSTVSKPSELSQVNLTPYTLHSYLLRQHPYCIINNLDALHWLKLSYKWETQLAIDFNTGDVRGTYCIISNQAK